MRGGRDNAEEKVRREWRGATEPGSTAAMSFAAASAISRPRPPSSSLLGACPTPPSYSCSPRPALGRRAGRERGWRRFGWDGDEDGDMGEMGSLSCE